jgi:hypothetical protein
MSLPVLCVLDSLPPAVEDLTECAPVQRPWRPHARPSGALLRLVNAKAAGAARRGYRAQTAGARNALAVVVLAPHTRAEMSRTIPAHMGSLESNGAVLAYAVCVFRSGVPRRKCSAW